MRNHYYTISFVHRSHLQDAEEKDLTLSHLVDVDIPSEDKMMKDLENLRKQEASFLSQFKYEKEYS